MGLTKAQLIAAIEGKISAYSVWTIGITEDPTQRKIKHGSPTVWYQWEGESEKTAREVEKHFIDKGCKGGTGGGDRPHWVYIFI